MAAGAPRAPQPVTTGIPLPRGWLHDVAALELRDQRDECVPTQGELLASWSDGSIKWLLLDFLLPELALEAKSTEAAWTLVKVVDRPTARSTPTSALRVTESPEALLVETGSKWFRVDRRSLAEVLEVRTSQTGSGVSDQHPAQVLSAKLLSRQRRLADGRITASAIEAAGPLRATIVLEGEFAGAAELRFVCRLCFFAGSGLVRVRLTIHNPRRAAHRGGLWDLGDSGSVLFRSLELLVRPGARGAAQSTSDAEQGATGDDRLSWWVDLDQPSQNAPGSELLAIEQVSSGGENWQSINHVDRSGRVPLQYRGYVVRQAEGKIRGDRATPVLARRGRVLNCAVAVPEFWQQFPKRLTSHAAGIDIELFPQFEGWFHELQGGEQKTHAVWLNFAASASAEDHDKLLDSLDWVHRPARAATSPDWNAASNAVAFLLPANQIDPPLADVLREAVHGPRRLVARRELIDEYGWRNFGDWFADHEAQHYAGPGLPISHYNNQFDGLLGSLRAWLASGDPAWFELGDALARHVIDIDLYHTERDRAAYNGGLFWFTDHYRTAATSTHRTYSRQNRGANGAAYGGGPGPEHNFTSGLLYYWYLTGDPQAREAVLSLADWTIAMDDGRRTMLGWLDSGPTGLASMTASVDYHGPGRGAGNSLNTLLDGWLASGRRRYLEYAQRLIRRVVHPADEIDALELLNAEKRWSYTVFLVALARYLDVKAEAGEQDEHYAYAQASLAHYARWMLEHERPYFDRRSELEYPTEAWPVQELRKANVLRLAAAHVDEPTRGRLLARGRELADRAWHDWAQFATRDSTRAISLLLIEGARDAWFRRYEPDPAPRAPGTFDFGTPEHFVPQRKRVRQLLQSPTALVRLGISRLLGTRRDAAS
ncbi:MAG: hypothetical protein K2Y37_05995 [Pirellulales bacterium]|nr:hypothetical protein [Pirellulales bacterium]